MQGGRSRTPARPPAVPPASRCAEGGSYAGNDAAGGGEQAALRHQAHGGCNLAVERAVAIQERNDLAQRGVRRGDGGARVVVVARGERSEEHTSELQSLMRISYAVFCLKKKTKPSDNQHTNYTEPNSK